MSSPDLETRVRALELITSEHTTELRRRGPLLDEAHSEIKEVVSLLKGALGSKGFIANIQNILHEYREDIDRIRFRQYFIMGGIFVVGAIEPILLRLLMN